MFVIVGIGCAEQWGAFGLIKSGWLSGWTLWHCFYALTILSAAYGVFSLFEADARNRSLRIVLVFALLLGAQGFRIGLADDVPVAPDGYLMVWPEEALFLSDSEVDMGMIEIGSPTYQIPIKVCVFLDSNTVALNWTDHYAPWATNTNPKAKYVAPQLLSPWSYIFSPR